LSPGAFDQYEQLARKAIQLDPNLAFARTVLAHALAFRREYEASMSQLERAIALNPNHPDWRLGFVLILAGDASRAVDLLAACVRLDPFCHPLTGGILGFGHYMLGQYAQALPLLRDFAVRGAKWGHSYTWLAATYARLGLLDEAREQVQQVQRLRPQYAKAGSLRQIFSFKDAKDEAHFLDALCLAGLPE
jgi:adenylate cyclase